MKTLTLIALLLSFSLTKALAQDPEKTLKNLQNAYQEEANAAKRYEFYSQIADKEGFREVSDLFCALSTSALIHMTNHREAIKKLGAAPEQVLYEKLKYEPTKKNLKESIKDETIDRRYTYPDYIHEAKKEHADQALQAFTYAKDSEARNESLLKAALDKLGDNEPEDYYVSNKTGKTVEVNEAAPAPQPQLKGEEFIKIQ